MKSTDPVERAFELMREEFAAPGPDAALEARLRRRFHTRSPSASRRVRIVALAALAIGGTGATAAALAASGGIDWLKSWWYSVRVDDRTVTGIGEDGTATTIPFRTADGASGTVRMQRDRLKDGGVRTRIGIDRVGNGTVDAERLERSSNERERFPLSELDRAVSLYAGTSRDGEAFEVFATPRLDDAAGSRLLLRVDDGHELPVLELATLPFDVLASGSTAEFAELEDGALSLAFDDGRGGALEFVWVSDEDVDRGAAELELPDGSVRVRVDDSTR